MVSFFDVTNRLYISLAVDSNTGALCMRYNIWQVQLLPANSLLAPQQLCYCFGFSKSHDIENKMLEKLLDEDMNTPIYDWKVWIYCSFLAAAVPIIIPAVQFGYVFNLWKQYNKPVSKEHCSCSCWDTVFKGKIYFEKDECFDQ